ncbi:hypothetical protein [Nitrosomonas oligotropha]|uniref:hypothetical protein n=1 Tax=Nitrosomonas oligotropha TaxID=42354 RepID=UPI00136A4F96|nr:hypothetical protein [Nitrosomonas oligotropha]
MDEKERIKQEIIEELTEDFGVALALIVGGIAREIDERELFVSLKAQLDAARSRPKIPPRAIEIASYAVIFLEAQCKNSHQGDDKYRKH